MAKHLCVNKRQSVLRKNSNFNFKSFNQTAMNPKLLLIALSVASFSSCTTTYKNGQTPDDVYYSPVRPVEREQNNKQDDDQDDANDWSIRMGVRDYRWRNLDWDNDYRYNNYPYASSIYYNNHYFNNHYYYGTPVNYKSYRPVRSTPRTVNLNAYPRNTNSTSSNPKTGAPVRVYNNSNGKSGLGNTIRQMLSGSGKSSSNNNRDYNPGNSGNSGNSNNSGNSGSGKTSSGNSSSGNSNSGSATRPNRGD